MRGRLTWGRNSLRVLGGACVLAIAIGGTPDTAAARDLVADKLDDGGPAGWTALDTSTPGPTPSASENAGGSQFCSDGIDNDFNGLIDCRDLACTGVAPCDAHPVPAVSGPSGLILAGAVLGVAGLLALARTRRRARR
ncbi:MAG: hypothetical protein ACRERC_01125 [Candidatus Binatia bacterium]